MQQKEYQYGWARIVLGAILMLCVLGATTAAASHMDLAAQQSDDGHCGLCMLGATLVAVVVALAIYLSCCRVTYTTGCDTELPGFVQVRVRSIRPPPAASFPH
jgi:hypothetical protein